MSQEKYETLLCALLGDASTQADNLLVEYDREKTQLERRISDLELSPLLDKQFLATALRLADDLCLSGGVRQSLFNRFRNPAPTVAIDAHRRAIEREVKAKGLPMELASDYVNTLERGLAVPFIQLGQTLWGYATLYEDLWSDPRIAARVPTRRIMLAMTTVLRARSAQVAATGVRLPAPAASRHSDG